MYVGNSPIHLNALTPITVIKSSKPALAGISHSFLIQTLT